MENIIEAVELMIFFSSCLSRGTWACLTEASCEGVEIF